MRIVSAVLLVVCLAPVASAEFDYTWIGASYGNVDFDDLNVDGDGFGLDGSLGVTESFHLFGAVETADLDFNVDITRFSAGVGYNTPLAEAIDVIAQLSYESLDIDTAIGNADDDGFGLGAGFRAELTDLVELNGLISYVDYDDSGDDTIIDLGLLFNLSDQLALGVNGSFDDDVSTYRLAGRFYF